VFVQDLCKPTIKLLFDLESPASDAPPLGGRDVLMDEAEDDWCLDFIAFLLEHQVPEKKAEREKVMRCSTNYVIIGTEFHWRSTSNGVLMKCILRSKSLRLLEEIHGGECGNRAASANFVGKAFRSSFY
jgi:hypothetical protein